MFGYIVSGEVLCARCAGDREKVPLHPENVLPYSQRCFRCLEYLYRGTLYSAGDSTKLLELYQVPSMSPTRCDWHLALIKRAADDHDWEALASLEREFVLELLQVIQADSVCERGGASLPRSRSWRPR